MLGVEADGATYHSAATARDRDRLRQSVLEKLGWKIHRIWSPDWTYQRANEIKRLDQVLKNAKTELQESDQQMLFEEETGTEDENEGEAADKSVIRFQREITELEKPPEAEFYKYCNVAFNYSLYNSDFHDSYCLSTQIDLLKQIVEIESPVHIEIASRRMINGWGREQVNSHVIETVKKAVYYAQREKALFIRKDILWSPNDFEKLKKGIALVTVRVPSNDDVNTRRNIKFIAQEEIQAAMMLILKNAYSLDFDSLMSETRRLFGFARSGETIKQVLSEAYDDLISRKLIQLVQDKVSIMA